jgi:glycosyltransferase involved in cell wall biosynthesis
MGSALSPQQRRDVAHLPDLELFESTFKLEWMRDPWKDVRKAGEWLLDLEEKVRPDVVHLNGYAHGALPWRAPTLIVAHSCVLSWWEAVKGCPAPDSWERYRHEITRGLRSADMVAAPSKNMLNCCIKHYGPLLDTRVIYNGRKAGPFLYPTRKEPFILTAGRLWDEAKNLAAVAAVAPQVSWPICVAGEDKHPDGGQATAGTVRLLGQMSLDELAPWFRRASVYALPARYEPFGLTALEAALAGCALVLGDIPSLREIWGDAAIFVPSNDHEALVRVLRDLIASPERRNHLGHRAQQIAMQYTPQRMARGYLSAYRELARREEHMLAAAQHPAPGPGYHPMYR